MAGSGPDADQAAHTAGPPWRGGVESDVAPLCGNGIGVGAAADQVRVAGGEPGAEVQIDFSRLRMLTDAPDERRRVAGRVARAIGNRRSRRVRRVLGRSEVPRRLGAVALRCYGVSCDHWQQPAPILWVARASVSDCNTARINPANTARGLAGSSPESDRAVRQSGAPPRKSANPYR